MKKRITYFDLAKGIGIILVVLGHMENIYGGLRTWISSFHMPLFFVISGMLLIAKGEINADTYAIKDIRAITKKTAKGLLIPYLWFSLIYVPIDIMNLFIQNVDEHTFIQNILDSATLAGISVMWFLPALFIAEIISLCLVSVARKLSSKKFQIYVCLYILALIISIVSYGIWTKIRPIYDANMNSYFITTALGVIRTILRGMAMSIHVVSGIILFTIISYIDERYADKKLEIRGYSLAAGVFLFVINISLSLKNGAVDNHFMTFNTLPLYYMCALLGSLSIIIICKGFASIGFIDFLGRNSLIIMATHLQCYILYAGIRIALVIDQWVTRAKSYIYMFNSVLFTMLIEVIIILVINKFFPFITGKGSIKDLFTKSPKNE